MKQSLEICVKCGEPTGRAGRGEDSLYTEDDCGPFCVNCYEIITKIAEEDAREEVLNNGQFGVGA